MHVIYENILQYRVSHKASIETGTLSSDCCTLCSCIGLGLGLPSLGALGQASVGKVYWGMADEAITAAHQPAHQSTDPAPEWAKTYGALTRPKAARL